MKNLLALAIGLLLLVSAAAATGNYNSNSVCVSEEMSGNCITGASVGQVVKMDANILGSNIQAGQTVDLQMEDSCLTGLNDGRTNSLQMVDMMLNDTGCNNIDNQYVEFAQGDNCVTIGNITQMAIEKADNIGSNNYIDQCSKAFAGVYEDAEQAECGSPNCLTNSNLMQVQVLSACLTGDYNAIIQEDDQYATDNCLTSSKLYEQVSENANILGCNNGNVVDPYQSACQNADNNCLANSLMSEIISQDVQIIGDYNGACQNAYTDNQGNCLTSSTSQQSIDMSIKEMGCNNFVSQTVSQQSGGNCVTGGNIAQQSSVNNND